MDEMNEVGASQAANAPQQSPMGAQASMPSIQPEPDGSQMHASRTKLIVPTIIILIVLVGIMYYSLQYFAFNNNHTLITIPAANTSTIIVNTTTSTIAVALNGYDVILRQYALYRIPNASKFQEYPVGNSTVPAEPFTRGAVGGSLSEFGLSFMNTLINSTVELPWNYNQTVPAQYANASYPVGVIIQTFNFTNSTNAARFLLYDQYYNKTINETLNGPIPRFNNTVQVYMPLDGYAFLTNISGYSNASAFYKTTLVHNFTAFNGTPIIMVQNTPLYQHLDQYLIGFQYKTYVVYVTGYGIYGHLNMSYPLATVKYMLQALRGNPS